MSSALPDTEELILAINSGSSSLKVGYFRRIGDEEEAILTALAENIGREDGQLRLLDGSGNVLLQQSHVSESQSEALSRLVEKSREHLGREPVAVAHRIVHGGPDLVAHQVITADVLSQLEAAVHFAPLHIPAALTLVRQAQALFPQVPCIACFDTAFHTTMPEAAKRFAVPEPYHERGVRRFGFHGLSYESVVHRLADRLPGRMIVAHLGNGSSLCALKWGRSVDTTMGLTPTGGIPMATRTGDLDPGVLLFLQRSEGLTTDALEDLLNHGCGLKALSGGESDMQALLRRRAAGDPAAALAIDVYVRSIRKVIGGYAAVLGGLDLLVFTGGIGEHSAEIRAMICHRMEFLGLADERQCARTAVMPAAEEPQMARISRALLAGV